MSDLNTRKAAYEVGAANRRLRREMMKSLQSAKHGSTRKAKEEFLNASAALKSIKEEHAELLENEAAKDAGKSVSYSEFLQASVAQAHQMQARKCGGISFHYYS